MLKLPNYDNRGARECYRKYLTCWSWMAILGVLFAVSLIVWAVMSFATPNGRYAMLASILLGVAFAVADGVLFFAWLDLWGYLETGEVIYVSDNTQVQFKAFTEAVKKKGGTSLYGEDYFFELFKFQKARNQGSWAVSTFFGRFNDDYGPLNA